MESELVSGFMTEHSAVIFVFFFLAEYASIVLMCILISILFLGGYNLDYVLIEYVIDLISWNLADISYILLEYLHYLWNTLLSWWELTQFNYILYTKYHVYLTDYCYQNEHFNFFYLENTERLQLAEYLTNPVRESFVCAFVIGFKTFIMIFIFIWVRASFPRIRFDQLMSYCWTVLIPIIFAFIILIPCILYSFDIVPANVLFF